MVKFRFNRKFRKECSGSQKEDNNFLEFTRNENNKKEEVSHLNKIKGQEHVMVVEPLIDVTSFQQLPSTSESELVPKSLTNQPSPLRELPSTSFDIYLNEFADSLLYDADFALGTNIPEVIKKCFTQNLQLKSFNNKANGRHECFYHIKQFIYNDIGRFKYCGATNCTRYFGKSLTRKQCFGATSQWY